MENLPVKQFYELKEYGRIATWRRAQTASQLAQHMSVRHVAEEIGVGRSYLGEMIRTWRTFGGPVAGLNNVTFAHYRAAVKTAVPFFWLELAAELNLSARELARILKLGPLTTRCFGELKGRHRHEMILANAAAIFLGHNHPSGDPTPSRNDIVITQKMVKAGKILGIEVLDHAIIGLHGCFVSMKANGLMETLAS